MEQSTRRWLLWGTLAILALGAVILFFIFVAADTDPEPPAEAGQIEWSVETSEYTEAPGVVTLKGDLPRGFPTETWLNDEMVMEGGDMIWVMDADPPVPSPVYEIDQAEGCDELNALLNKWAQEIAVAPGEGPQTQAAAFAQYAADTMREQGCEPSVEP